MALLSPRKTGITAFNALRRACRLLASCSPIAPSAAAAEPAAYLLGSATDYPDAQPLPVTSVLWNLNFPAMTTLRRPTRPAEPAHLARDGDSAKAGSDVDDTKPCCSNKTPRRSRTEGEVRLGIGAPGRLTDGVRSAYGDAYLPCGAPLRRFSSNSLPRQHPHTHPHPQQGASAGDAAAGPLRTSKEQRLRRSGSLSAAASLPDDPPSDESCLSPSRLCQKQQQNHHQQQHQQHQQNKKKVQDHDPHSGSLRGQSGRRDVQDPHQRLPEDQQTCVKSAKRRAAEALLAARLGGVGVGVPSSATSPPTALPLYPPHALAAASVDLHASCATRAFFAVDRWRNADVGCPAVAVTAAVVCRHMSCSSDAAGTQSSGSGMESSETLYPEPSAAAGSRRSPLPQGPSAVGAAAGDAAGPSSLAALQLRVDSMTAAAAAAESKLPQGLMKLGRTVSVPRQLVQVQVPGPPPKRARLSLSAAATSTLGAGLSGAVGGAAAAPHQHPTSSSGRKQPQSPGKAAATKVPPCDPGRGCKARLQEAAAAAALAKRPGGPGGVNEGDAAGDCSSPTEATAAAAAAAAAAAGGTTVVGVAVEPVWCGFEVTLPHVNWQAVYDEPPGALQRFSLAKGYEKLILPQGLVTYVVENERHVGDALRHLKAGMQDRLVAIDLEWRPETVAGRVSPVALLQLSSASVCLVVRTCCMGYGLPPELAEFLVDPAVVLLGFGWDSADEAKMRGTFGLGRADFRRFLDLQEVAASLGYHGFGLSRMSQQVLGLPLHKSKSISRSNWAAPQLTNHQLKYASLDVLVAGQLFRALRLWHSSPSPCADCRSPIGELVLPGPLRCGNPDCGSRPAANLLKHRSHCASTGHPARYGACNTCGRLYELPGAAEIRQS